MVQPVYIQSLVNEEIHRKMCGNIRYNLPEQLIDINSAYTEAIANIPPEEKRRILEYCKGCSLCYDIASYFKIITMDGIDGYQNQESIAICGTHWDDYFVTFRALFPKLPTNVIRDSRSCELCEIMHLVKSRNKNPIKNSCETCELFEVLTNASCTLQNLLATNNNEKK